MATRRYKVSPGDTYVTEDVGAATDAETVELTIDLATTEINGLATATRGISKAEALECVEKIRQHILSDVWPPA